ncbi:MAG TPA: aminoacyl-tRNA hydrolase [Candidatus Paceibacterota bacterium]|nr:aminoacyl-tRNA hydrolase [Candidatus Paceibacterota bacterium]
MRRGKEAAQASHASMKVFFDRMKKSEKSEHQNYNTQFTPEMEAWMQGAFTKVVVGVETEDQIYQLAEQARQANIPYAIIIDNGMTEFAGNKTTTALAIGPDEAIKIDKITGDLKLR